MMILVTRFWGGLGLAMLAQRQGAQVVCAVDPREVPDDEREATDKIGDGLVDKVSWDEAQKLKRHGHLWVFDSNDLGKEADELRTSGELVIGTSALSQRLEEDREFGIETARALGFAIPETEQFTDANAGIQYLQERPDQMFAFKPDAEDPTATYVPMTKDDPPKANQELQEYLASVGGKTKSFILQEVVNGIEVNFDLWVRDGQPVAAFCDLESKRKLTGDVGEHCGCAGDYVVSLPVETGGVHLTAGRYLDLPAVRRYTGTIDANVIVVDGRPYFLENCFRFGYNAYATLFHQLAAWPVEDTLRQWVSGSGDLASAFHPHIGGSLSLMIDEPKDATPILVPPEIADDVYFYRMYAEEGRPAIVEGWDEVCCVTASGETIPDAGQQCLAMAKAIGLPDKGYRIDLASDGQPNLPAARHHALQEIGWLEPQGVEA